MGDPSARVFEVFLVVIQPGTLKLTGNRLRVVARASKKPQPQPQSISINSRTGSCACDPVLLVDQKAPPAQRCMSIQRCRCELVAVVVALPVERGSLAGDPRTSRPKPKITPNGAGVSKNTKPEGTTSHLKPKSLAVRASALVITWNQA